MISYYNTTKSGVDTFNKLVREYSCTRCTRRWTLPLFVHFIDMATCNALVIWHIKNPTWEKQESMYKKRKLFLEMLARDLYSSNIDRRWFEHRDLILQKEVLTAIENARRKLRKINIAAPTGAKRSDRCHIFIGNNNKYSNECTHRSQFVCNNHATIQKEIICSNCEENE